MKIGDIPIIEYVRTNRQKIDGNSSEIERIEGRFTNWIEQVETDLRYNFRVLVGIFLTTMGTLITGIISLLMQL